MTGAEEINTEVLSLEMVPCPGPGQQYVSQAGRMLQVHDGGGGSRATMTKASSRVDNAHASLSDADINRSSLVAEAGFGTEVAGSESRADVALKDESVGVAGSLGGRYMLEDVMAAVLDLKAELKASGSVVVAEFSAEAINSEGGAASDSKIFEDDAPEWEEWEHKLWRSGQEADQVRFDQNSKAKMALPDVD